MASNRWPDLSGFAPPASNLACYETALNDTGSKSFFEKITYLANQASLFLCQIVTTEGLHFFQRFDQLKLLVTVR